MSGSALPYNDPVPALCRRALLRQLGAGAVAGLGALACGPRELTEDPHYVFAASSLREAFELISRDFQANAPAEDPRLALSFGGSSTLRVQIEHGAPAIAFASADARQSERLHAGGHCETPQLFARNRLVLAVGAESKALTSFDDLPRAERIVLADAAVPAGRYAQLCLARRGASFEAAVREKVVSFESNVRRVRAKIESGDADAGIVYVTDLLATPALRVIEIDPQLQPEIGYYAAATTRSTQPALGRRFVEHLLAPTSQDTMASLGFGRVA